MFARQLAGIEYLTLNEVTRYGVSAEHPAGIKLRCIQWAAELNAVSRPHTSASLDVAEELRVAVERAQLDYPTPAPDVLGRPGPQARPGHAGRPATRPGPADRV